MSRVCELTGKKAMVGNNVSHAMNKTKRKFTYRFVLLPETIGSISYLSKFKKIMKKNVICGYNLSCVGDTRSYSYVPSRKGNTIADLYLKGALRGLQNVKK